MRTMLRALVAAGLGLALAGSAFAAAGNLTLSWNGCTNPTRNLILTPGQTTVRLVASVTGHSDKTISYEVRVLLGDADNLVPDAWRFDPAGCQGSARATFETEPPAALASGCPSFLSTPGDPNLHELPPITRLDFVTEWPGIPPTVLRAVYARVAEHSAMPDPSATYFLMDVAFDLGAAVNGPTAAGGTTCGGLETPMVFQLDQAAYCPGDGDYTELPFVVAPGAGTLTVNAGGATGPTAPAHPATWGSIKAQYRN